MMNFWEAQKKARSKTALYITLFIAMAFATAVVVEAVSRTFLAQEGQEEFSIPIGLLFFLITCLVALFQYLRFKNGGGAAVAESVGARQVNPHSANPKDRLLLNVVDEIAIASNLPRPKVYILEANQINAFAAGMSKEDAAICVTRGTLDKLNREELEGVIAHEFGHIYNRDMKISLQLAAMVMGFFFVLYIGMRLVQVASYSRRREDGKGGAPLVLIAALLTIAGAFTWFFGSILKATVSREREYLADACAVQFTRSTSGIANALRKIGRDSSSDMPAQGMAFSHLYIDNHSGINALFATHPPLIKRIEALEGGRYDFEQGK